MALPITDSPQAPAGQIRLGAGGVAGNPAQTRVQQIDPSIAQPSSADRTLDAVIEIGKGALERNMQEQQNKQFLQGVQRVMTGEALKDIVDEQPWYTEIFGPTSSAQGARAYSQMAQVDKYTADLYGNMGTYEQMTPDEVGKVVTGNMNKFLTGDDVTDTAIQMKMVESLGPFFKQHAKDHYKWQQNQMVQSVQDSMLSSANTLQAAARNWTGGTATDQDMNEALGAASLSWVPPAGMSSASYWKAISQATKTSLAQGNHYMAKALWADIGGKGSVISHAPADVQEDLINARDTYEAKTKQKEANLEFGTRMGELAGLMKSGQISPAQGAQQMLLINKQFQLKTGIDGDLYDKNDFETLVSGNIAFQYKQRLANSKVSATEAAQMRLATEIAKGVGMAKPASVINMGAPKNDVDNAVSGQLATYKTIPERNAYLTNAFYGDQNGAIYIHGPTKQTWDAGVASAASGYNSAFGGVAQQIGNMLQQPGGQGVVDAYLGPTESKRMQEFIRMENLGNPPEVAWQLAGYGKPVNSLQTTTPKEMKTLVSKQVAEGTPGVITSLLPGNYMLTDTSNSLVMSQLAKNYDMINSRLLGSSDEAIKRAWQLTSQDVDILGPYAYNKTNSSDPKLGVLIGASDEGAGRAMADYIQQQLPQFDLPGREARMKSNSVNIQPGSYVRGLAAERQAGNDTHLPWYQQAAAVTIMPKPDSFDADGQRVRTFMIIGSDKNGNPVSAEVNSTQLRSFYEKQPYFK